MLQKELADLCRSHEVSVEWVNLIRDLDRLQEATIENDGIREVVADIDENASEIVLTVHWAGGVHTERRLPKRRRGQHRGG